MTRGFRHRHLRSDLGALAALAAGIGEFVIGHMWARNFIPQLGLAALVLAALCGISRLWFASVAWAAAAILAAATVLPSYLPRSGTTRPGCIVTVVNFNKAENPPDDAGAIKLLGRLHPDIVFGEKVYGEQFSRDILTGAFSGYSSFSAPGATLILSRFPIVRSYRGGEGGFLTNAADILVAGRTVRLLNMYVSRPNKDPAIYLADYRALQTELRRANGPVLLAGDGNATEYSEEVGHLRRLIHDTWDEVGFGLGATFPGPWRWLGIFGPWLRIDYIFHNDSFDAMAMHRVDEADGAGHYPLWAKLVLVGAGPPGEPCK